MTMGLRITTAGYYRMGLAVARELEPVRSEKEVAKILGIRSQEVNYLSYLALGKVAYQMRKDLPLERR